MQNPVKFNLKTLTLSGVMFAALCGSLLASGSAFADHEHRKYRGDDRDTKQTRTIKIKGDYDTRRYHDDQRRGDYVYKDHRKPKYHRGGRLRVDIPVRLRGDSRLPLKRMLRREHGIDPSQYRLVKVVVNTYGRYQGAASLRVGDRATGYQYLNRGRNHIQAPRGHRNERWLLNIADTKVSNVRLVLEPRGRGHRLARNERHHDRYSWDQRRYTGKVYNW